MLRKLHHVAYRCRDAGETVDFYTKIIGLKLAATVVQDQVPSSGITEPHSHIFFEMEDGSHIAFFDILGDNGPMTPAKHDWAQHLALEVANDQKAEEISSRLKAAGVDVVGPVKHGELVRSWYFFDPSGHRMEVTVKVPGADPVWNSLEKMAYDDLARWQDFKISASAVMHGG